MVYVDENGQKCEHEYCVVLKKGEDAGIRNYTWASEDEIKTAMNKIRTICFCSIEKNNQVNFRYSIFNIDGSYNLERIGSLVFIANDEKNANEFKEKIGLLVSED